MIPSMQPPTDNVYKFYAIFGLVCLIAAFSSAIFLGKPSVDAEVALQYKIQDIQAIAKPTLSDLRNLTRLKRDHARAVRASYNLWTVCLFAAGAGGALTAVGFALWHFETQRQLNRQTKLQTATLQVQFEIAQEQKIKLQLDNEKQRLELSKLKDSLSENTSSQASRLDPPQST